MKQYVLKENTNFYSCGTHSEELLEKGTEIQSNGCVDGDGGIKGTVMDGKHKGREIIFSRSELKEMKAWNLKANMNFMI